MTSFYNFINNHQTRRALLSKAKAKVPRRYRKRNKNNGEPNPHGRWYQAKLQKDQERDERMRSLEELTRLTEEYGGYDAEIEADTQEDSE